MARARTRLAVAISNAAGLISRIAGGSGTSFPGRVLLALDPRALAHLSADLTRGSVIVSATNGKTTTTSMIAGILERESVAIVHNSAGANMAGGIAAALAKGTAGRSTDALGLFEVDEFWLEEIAHEVKPSAVVLGNLFRDQLDRYGELDSIAERWRRTAVELSRSGTTLILCGDDPLIASVGDGLENVVWYGINDSSVGLDQLPHAADSLACRKCGAELVYDTVLLGHLGHWRCGKCSERRPQPDFSITNVTLNGATGSTVLVSDNKTTTEVHVPLPGLYNAYNALAAFAMAKVLGVGEAQIAEAIAATPPAFGRAETVDVDGIITTMMLIKNPTGANEVIRALAFEEGPIDLAVLLNDRIADGRDVSWVWDADFEELAASVNSVFVGGTRAHEMALRLRYADFAPERIIVIDDNQTIFKEARERGSSHLWVLPTYTAMLEFRDLLERQGWVGGVK